MTRVTQTIQQLVNIDAPARNACGAEQVQKHAMEKETQPVAYINAAQVLMQKNACKAEQVQKHAPEPQIHQVVSINAEAQIKCFARRAEREILA